MIHFLNASENIANIQSRIGNLMNWSCLLITFCFASYFTVRLLQAILTYFKDKNKPHQKEDAKIKVFHCFCGLICCVIGRYIALGILSLLHLHDSGIEIPSWLFTIVFPNLF